MSDIAQPLSIPRDKLIERLTEVQAEAAQKRADAATAERTRRQAVLDAVSRLSTDQVANMLAYQLGLETDALVKWVNEKVDDGKFKTIDPPPTAIETALDRTIRVLNLASDNEIQVKPSDSLYAYL